MQMIFTCAVHQMSLTLHGEHMHWIHFHRIDPLSGPMSFSFWQVFTMKLGKSNTVRVTSLQQEIILSSSLMSVKCL